MAQKHRWIILFAASCLFYYWLFPQIRQVLLFGATILISWLGGILIPRTERLSGGKRKAFLAVWIILSAMPLFFMDGWKMIASLTGGRISFPDLIIPVGLSFYTLQMIAYLADIYRKKIGPQKNFLKYALFISFFPQLLQGPIPRFKDLSHQLTDGNDFDPANIQRGFQLILWGFFLKFMMADKVSIFVDIDSRLYMNAPLKGWSTLIYYADPDYMEFIPYERGDSDERAGVNELQKEYLIKIGDLCRQNGITLILTNLPGNKIPNGEMTDGMDNVCSDLAKEIDADYYNLCEKSLYEKLGVEPPEEWVVMHSNYRGSVRLSQYTGKLLSEKYHIPAVKDEQYESTRDFYAMVSKAANLQYVEDFDEYLDAINDPNYTVFFSIQDEGTNDLTDSEMEKLRSLGIQSDLKGKFRYSWCAVVNPGTEVKEEVSENETVVLNGVFDTCMTDYSVSSTGNNAGTEKSSIKIQGTEYCHQSRGINIVVWDNIGRTIIDSVTFDTYDGSQPSRSWFIDMKKNKIDINFVRW